MSIYIKAGPRTRDFHEILDILENQKGVKIPEHVNLEMVHDLRNNIQHRGAAVLKSETDFYIKTTSDFMKGF